MMFWDSCNENLIQRGAGGDGKGNSPWELFQLQVVVELASTALQRGRHSSCVIPPVLLQPAFHHNYIAAMNQREFNLRRASMSSTKAQFSQYEQDRARITSPNEPSVDASLVYKIDVPLTHTSSDWLHDKRLPLKIAFSHVRAREMATHIFRLQDFYNAHEEVVRLYIIQPCKT